MIDLISSSQVLLRDAGFDVRLITLQRITLVCFEDAGILGFCTIFETPSELLKRWKQSEQEVLNRFAQSFRSAGDKAWNVYCVFLCAAECSSADKREIGWIEEDLDRTRKIAACGVSSREALCRALLPVLPIQYQPILLHENVTERLTKRIRDIAPNAEQIVLDASVPAAQVVNFLGERS